MSSHLRCALLSALMLGLPVALGDDASGRWHGNQPLRDPSPLAFHDEIVRRVLSPVAYDVAVSLGDDAASKLRAQSLPLEGEHVDLYVPAREPAAGYGLLVFVAPTRDLSLPMAWRHVLAERGVILVAPRNAGNGSHGLARRVPLALLAYEHARARYRLDPERLYVGGFSGGSRIALTVAIAYADVFRGAFLVAGSSEVGAGGPTPPSSDVMAQLQARTRMAFVTGERDRGALDRDRRSERRLREYCVANLATFVQRRRGHQLPDGHGLAEGLDFLDARSPPSPELPACQARLEREVAIALDAASDVAAAGRAADAGALLAELDRRYGGLAAPRSVTLARCLLRGTGC